MKRFYLFPTLAALALLLTACPQPTPEPPPPPLELAWQTALVTPDVLLEVDAAAGGGFVYVFNEELPLDGDYSKKWAALWRVDAASGEALGPVKFPDDAAAATLAANGFGCPQPLAPYVVVDGQGAVYTRVALRNAAAQADGCDTFDGSWVASSWAVFGVFDAGLNRTGLAWLKAFGGDDPTYAAAYARLARADAGAVVAGAYQADARLLQTQTFRGSLSPDGTLNVALEGPLGEHVYRAFSLPEGWLAVERPDDPDAAGWGERLVRRDAAGAVLWSVVTSQGFPPTERAAGGPGSAGDGLRERGGEVRDALPGAGAAGSGAQPGALRGPDRRGRAHLDPLGPRRRGRVVHPQPLRRRAARLRPGEGRALPGDPQRAAGAGSGGRGDALDHQPAGNHHRRPRGRGRLVLHLPAPELHPPLPGGREAGGGELLLVGLEPGAGVGDRPLPAAGAGVRAEVLSGVEAVRTAALATWLN
ncbi:hypothetical protein ACMC9I_02420 [Deinococcota bacterium DY0809b]